VNSLIYLQNRCIVHGDVKPGNILMSKDHKTLKLCDFGFSVRIVEENLSESDKFDQYDMEFDTEEARNSTEIVEYKPRRSKRIVICGSPIYMAPEIRRLEYVPSYKTDIWSLGMVLHEMIFGYHPFRGIKDTRSVAEAIPKFKISNSRSRTRISAKSRSISLLKAMLDQNVDSRYDIEDVATNDWLIPNKNTSLKLSSKPSTDLSASKPGSHPIDIPVIHIDGLSDVSKSATSSETSSTDADSSDTRYTHNLLPGFEKMIQKKFKRTRGRLRLSDLFYTPRNPHRPNISGSCPENNRKRVIKSSKSIEPGSEINLDSKQSRSFSVSGAEVTYKTVPIENVIFGTFLA